MGRRYLPLISNGGEIPQLISLPPTKKCAEWKEENVIGARLIGFTLRHHHTFVTPSEECGRSGLCMSQVEINTTTEIVVFN